MGLDINCVTCCRVILVVAAKLRLICIANIRRSDCHFTCVRSVSVVRHRIRASTRWRHRIFHLEGDRLTTQRDAVPCGVTSGQRGGEGDLRVDIRVRFIDCQREGDRLRWSGRAYHKFRIRLQIGHRIRPRPTLQMTQWEWVETKLRIQKPPSSHGGDPEFESPRAHRSFCNRVG